MFDKFLFGKLFMHYYRDSLGTLAVKDMAKFASTRLQSDYGFGTTVDFHSQFYMLYEDIWGEESFC